MKNGLGAYVMGLFSSVLHVRGSTLEALLPALDAAMFDVGFSRTETLPITADGPFQLPNHKTSVKQGPYYLISPLNGQWLTIIEAHFALRGALPLAELSNRLSSALATYSLALVVHDDDLFFYNLEFNGESLDGYNSCPQYFEQERMADTKIEEQRHTPEAFQPLLPADRKIDELQALLNRGWWNAFNSGCLDENGIAQDHDDGFVFESERMIAFGNLLQLHGHQFEYPYAGWGGSKGIAWPEFIALRYRTQSP